MLPSSKNDAVWAASSGEPRFLTNPTSAVSLRRRPGVPATVYYEEPVSPLDYWVFDRPAMSAPLQQRTQSVPSPHYFCEYAHAKESRKLLLRRSLLDLVASHRYLALTDTELLRWYLRLSPEDRSILDDGGLYYFLLNHPGLELSQDHVYVKPRLGSTGCVLPAIGANQNIFHRPGSQECRCATCLQMLVMLPGDSRENLPQMACSNSVTRSRKQLYEEAQDNPVVHQMAYNFPLTQGQNQQNLKSSSSISAAVSLDVALESSRQRRKAEFWSQDLVAHSQRAASTIQAQSEQPVENSESSEQPRVDIVKITQHSDESIIHPVQLQQAPPPKGPAGENIVLGGKKTADNHVETRVGLEDGSEGDDFHSPMKDDSKTLMCLASNDLAMENAEAPVQPVSVSSDPPTTSWEALHVKSTAEKFTSTVPCEPSCVAAVNTKVERSTAKQTQTEGPTTAAQIGIMTELHMSDLDYLAEEFDRLEMLLECREPKKKKKSQSPGNESGASRKDCNYKQRAEQAELTLLSLHYELCRLHVWRLYYTSAEGHLPITIAKDPPPNVVKILQQLETDYNRMKHQILMGVPLEQLSPLCVECEKITTGACYIPEQIIGDVLEKAPPCTIQVKQKHDGAEDSGCPDDEDKKICQKSKLVKKEADEVRRAEALVPNDRFVKQIGCEEVSFSEAWYDAEEELQGSGPVEDMADYAESVGDESSSSVLNVPNLPGHVTHLINPPVLSSSIQIRKASPFPTAKGTCVPQHFGTMDGHTTLMAELTHLHRDVDRQTILDALMEIKTTHQGVLASLPLSTIRDMISDLLTKSAAATRI